MGSWLDLLELLPVSLAAEALPGAAISLQESDDATLAAPLRGEGAAEAALLPRFAARYPAAVGHLARIMQSRCARRAYCRTGVLDAGMSSICGSPGPHEAEQWLACPVSFRRASPLNEGNSRMDP